ncbi:MAG: hypothetical protein ABI569_08255 [Casimicrobiaceae bacterium]
MTFQNRLGLFLWGFAAVWLTMLFAMTYLVLRDGPPDGHSVPTTVLIMAFFWTGGIGLVTYVSRQPCFFVTVEDGTRVSVTWRYPHKVVRKVFASAQVLPATIVKCEDSEGGPYFVARVNTVAGESVDLAEGRNRGACERARARFNATLFK